MKNFRIQTDGKPEESLIICRENALDELLGKSVSMVFTDDNVYRIYRTETEKYFPGVPVHVMPAGEANKTQDTLFALLKDMAEAGVRRNGCIVCFGGGVVGDIGGLAAALYMRGIECVQVPTTLLAQVDSSVGGKTAIDFCGVKNLIGAFKQPERVLVDPAFLKTLPAREIRCGIGEIIKHGALSGPLFDKLQKNKERLLDLNFLSEIVPDNIALKADVVKNDAQERGLRKCLNLGHTTGHALELFHGKYSHGEYVLIGMLFEAELCKRFEPCDAQYLQELEALVCCAFGNKLPVIPPLGEAARFALLDKKNTAAGSVAVTAPKAKGEYALLEIPFEKYCAALAEIQEELC